jgi:hypothetical protein
MEQLPPDVIDAPTALDPEITPYLVQESWALLKPFHEKVGYAAPRIDRDLRYGDDRRHRLDVHTTGRGPAGEPASVFLFVHGCGHASAMTSMCPARRCMTTSARGGPQRLGRRHDDLPPRPRAHLAGRRGSLDGVAAWFAKKGTVSAPSLPGSSPERPARPAKPKSPKRTKRTKRTHEDRGLPSGTTIKPVLTFAS